MNKVASYLQEHIDGEVMTAPNVREHFSTDGSVLSLLPSMVVYPQNASDVRKIARFTWQLAEKGHPMSVTSRGFGANQGGAAIGKGIVVAFLAHMNRIFELDTKQRLVRAQPGVSFFTLQEVLRTHGYFLPAYPSAIESCTLGGAVADNSSGEKSLKYGTMLNYVKSLEVVLANGEIIQTERVSKRELSRKKGQTDFEGEVYRQLDNLITDNWDKIQKMSDLSVAKNTTGYNLKGVKHKDGSFDLTPLIVGSQGTLGMVTEMILGIEPYYPKTTLLAIYFESIDDLSAAATELRPLRPSAMELVDSGLIELVKKVNPARLNGLVDDVSPAAIMLLEFNDASDHKRHSKAKKAEKIIHKHSQKFAKTDDIDQQQKLWSLRHATAELAAHIDKGAQAIPIIDDAIVPTEKLGEFIKAAQDIFKKHHLKAAIWGHAGEASLQAMPFLDLSKLGDRQKAFKVMDEYYDLVVSFGGSPSSEHNDGRLRAPYVNKVYDDESYALLQAVKNIFDPFGTLNMGVKINVTQKDNVALLRKSYSLNHVLDQLPRL